jgi:hypothetical protein
MHALFRIAGLAIVAGLPAQHVIPADRAVVDGTAAGDIAGFGAPQRSQILIAASHLDALRGRTLHELWLRRDRDVPLALSGGTTRLRITLSTTTREPSAPASTFAANHGANTTTVFDAIATVPNSPQPTAVGYDAWAAENSIRVPFTSPFPYAGGTLCVDLVGTPIEGARYWPVDQEAAVQDGTATALGAACGRDLRPQTATAFPSSLRTGGTASLMAFGRAGTSAVLMFGAPLPGAGIDLGVIGLVGCTLHVQPSVSLPQAFEPPAFPSGPAHLRTHLPIPASASLAGASFVFQVCASEWTLAPHEWSNGLGLTLSNGVVATLAATPPTLGIARISAPATNVATPPTSGFVEVDRGPVLRFEHR